jgi:preprotein translocase subunit SecD
MVCLKKEKMKLKFTWKIWLWLVFLVLALVSIFITPHFLQTGLLIQSVEQNSTAFDQGLRQGQVITKIDGIKVTNLADFNNILQEKFLSNTSVKTTITTDQGEFIIYSTTAPEITVSKLPSTNIKTGLDLSGGTRALVKAEGEKLTSNQINDLVNIVSNRFNVYGISDISVRPVSDLSGNYFMMVEIAGATPKDMESLISQQGKFEAKIGNETVFIGGDKDITSVARSGQEAGIYSCSDETAQGYFCEFRFNIYLSEQAAQRHAALTDKLDVNISSNGNYLSKTLDLYVDDKLVDSLQIGESLKGRATTSVTVSGSGNGATKAEAIKAAEQNMKNLQTILITGSLPFKLEIVKLDTISPSLGDKFTHYILIAGIAALCSVALIIFIKYRKLKLVIPPLIICTSEIIITLGVAAFMQQDLDLPGIAGILAAIGTGIDDQIVVLDESRVKESLSLKQRIKRAFGIVLGAFFTSAVSLLPLLWAGAGLLKGFAIMTLIGITLGVFITRPAFADIINSLEED